jgi:thiol-disulfide isomerase/thioredoxin
MSSRATRPRPKAGQRTGKPRAAATSRRMSEPSGRRWLWWALPAGIAVLVALVVLSTTRSSSGGTSAQVSPAPATSGSASSGSQAGTGQVGERLATYTLTSIDGQQVRVPAGKPGAIFFMAGWCGTCIGEAQALGELERRLGDRISVLAVSPDPSDSVSAIRQLRAAAGNPRYPFAWDRQSTLARALAVSTLDTTLVYDKRGEVVYRDGVPTDAATLESAFRKAGA